MSRKPNYGEKNARFEYYRQKHQPPRSLQKLVGDDKKLMELCPSYGQSKLGVQALPLSLEDRDKYQSRKEREKANKGQTVQSQKVNARRARKEGAKRKSSTARTFTLPPDLPDPTVTVFLVDSTSQVSQLPIIGSARPEEAGPTSAATSPDYQPPRTGTNVMEHYALNAAPETVLPTLRAHPLQPAISGVGQWKSFITASGGMGSETASSTTSPPSYTATQLQSRILSSPRHDAPNEGHLNTVYQGPLAPHSLSSASLPALKEEDPEIPSIIPNTSHVPGNAKADMHDRLSHRIPSDPRLDVRTRDSTSTGTAGWTSSHQGRHSGPQHEPATAGSGLFRHHQRREQAEGRGPSNAPGMSGPVCATLGTFNYQSAANSYTSQSASHTRLNQAPATAELSAVAGYAHDVAAPSPPTSHQVQQHNEAAVRTHTWHSSGHQVSTRTSPSHEHTVRVCSATIGDMTSTSGVNSSNQQRLSAPTTTNKPQPTRSTRTSTGGYTELAHALGDDYSVVPYANETGPLVIAPPVVPQMGRAVIRSPSRPEPATFALHRDSMYEGMARMLRWPDNNDPFPSNTAPLSHGFGEEAMRPSYPDPRYVLISN